MLCARFPERNFFELQSIGDSLVDTHISVEDADALFQQAVPAGEQYYFTPGPSDRDRHSDPWRAFELRLP